MTMTSALTADALTELRRLDAAVTAAQGFIAAAEAGLEFGAALRKAFPALLSELEQSRVERKEMIEALGPFVRLYQASRERHMKRSAEAVKAGRVWFDEMPGDWIFETKGLTMADFRQADAILSRARHRDQT